jgi:hypothetical protein
MMTLEQIVSRVVALLRNLVPLIIGLAVVAFLYGMLGYMMNIGDETKRKESIRYMISGIVGLFVMVSIWGIVIIVTRTLGFNFGIPRIL